MNPINSALNHTSQRSMPKANPVTPETKEKRLVSVSISLSLGKLDLDELNKVYSYIKKMLKE